MRDGQPTGETRDPAAAAAAAALETAMPIKLLARAWRTATARSMLEPARRDPALSIEARALSGWNPPLPRAPRRDEPVETPEPKLAEPTWSDTQPWFHG
jgi:hypothetical protein